MLKDNFGRTFPYIRLSVTDVCNFKCGYCLPNGYQVDKSDNRKFLHMGSLAIGGIGFLMMYFVPDPELLWLWFSLVGISWGSILSMPYAMLSSTIAPEKMGIMMGIFNMFIVYLLIKASLSSFQLPFYCYYKIMMLNKKVSRSRDSISTFIPSGILFVTISIDFTTTISLHS